MTHRLLTACGLFAGALTFGAVGLAQGPASTGTISGTVTADQGEVRAFRVRARDTVHRIAYTVYTVDGRYRIFNLPPGTYDVGLTEEGFEVAPQAVQVTAGGAQTADIAAKKKAPKSDEVELVDFDTLYPPDPARDVLVRSCFGCHGIDGTGLLEASFNAHPRKSEAAWRRSVDRMFTAGAIGYGNWGEVKHLPYISSEVVSPSEKESIVKYLARNFGPDAKPRRLKTDPLVRNEAALSEALFIQYEVPPGHGMHDVFPSIATPGLIWFSGTPGAIAALDTRNPDFATRTKDYPISDPNGKVASHGIIESKGHVYWAEIAGGHIGELDPATGEIRRYEVPTKGAWQNTPRADTKGNIWFSDMSSANKIGKLDIVTKKITEIDGVKAWNGYGLVVDQRDRVWVSVVSNPWVPMYDSRTGKWSIFPTAAATRRPTVDSKGNVWAAQFYGASVSRIDGQTGAVKEYRLPLKYGNPYEVVAGPDDNLWIENSLYNAVTRLDPKTNTFLYYPFPLLGTHPRKMEVDAGGTLWFGANGAVTALKPRGNVPSRK